MASSNSSARPSASEAKAAGTKRSHADPPSNRRASTGIDGLDHILGGGFTRDRVYLVEGNPGSGKTTLALQFLRDGIRRGESVLYVTLSETRAELQDVAASHGWDFDGMDIFELSNSDETGFKPDDHYTFFHPSEVPTYTGTSAPRPSDAG